ncbi:MAG TPA: hypothetical protein VFU46_09640 [Gemmatimonadales bacterium]|nr:hypothetical protein [Gemmatimonadales bacterium]
MRKLAVALAGVLVVPSLAAQTPAHDPSSTLEQVLPAEVAAKVLQHIADARSRQLPAAALEHRALELAAKGVAPADIEQAVARQGAAMEAGQQALAAGGRTEPADDEVEAAGTALGKGVDGAEISELAKSAPSGRSLAVPLAVIASLTERGLPSDDALARVLARLEARASDGELQQLPEQAGQGVAHKPELTGPGLADTKRPEGAGPPSAAPVAGAPTSVPTNDGRGSRPTTPGKPTTPGRP